MTTEGQAAVSGIAGAVLFGVGSALWGLDMPEDGTPVAEVVDFYRDTDDRIVVGGSLSLLAIAAFLWFAAAMRRLLADAEGSDVLATTAFGGAVLGAATGIGAETINLVAALRAQDGELSDELAQPLFEISQVLGSAATAVGLGIFAIVTAAVALRTGRVLPRAVALFVGVVGIALLTPLAHVNWLAGVALIVMTPLVAIAQLSARASGNVSPRSPGRVGP